MYIYVQMSCGQACGLLCRLEFRFSIIMCLRKCHISQGQKIQEEIGLRIKNHCNYQQMVNFDT